ncbi:MAG: RagB/SusD family nutrient uptake outer membrane protein, partial [Dysgonamonadaceae bacterium]|nr:RagB/SusD family nutrient uptake outer membrane protein [Dysgonamonadaceae bacterium]
MKTIKYIILSLLSIGFVSCDFLDKEPFELTPETYFNNETELNTFLIGVYNPLMQEFFYGNNYPLNIAGGDDLTFYQRSSPTNGIICANANSANPEIMTYWRILYDGINRANMLLENADKNPEISPKVRNKAKAEALFLRSFYYFNLVQGWGDVPLRLTSAQSVEGLSIPRTDKQTIYDRITEDIKSAIPDLPKADTQTQTGTVTQSVAQGILARIYLFRAGEHYRDNKAGDDNSQKYFEEAKNWAEQVKSSNLHDLANSYNQVFIDICSDRYNSTGIRESLWEVEEAGNRIISANYSAGRIGNTLGFGSTNDYSASNTYKNYTGMKNPGYSYRFAYASLKLYELYEKQGDTERGDWNIAPYEYAYATAGEKEVTGRIYFEGKRPEGLTSVEGMPCTDYTPAQSVNKTRCAAKYRRELEAVTPKNKNYTPINFPILRYSDVLLMLAEAENEINGPTALAYECINKVRERAKITPLSGLSKDEFREALKDERAMELCFEALRRWDLIRWGEFYSKMTDMINYVSKPGWNTGHAYAANYYKVTP